MRRLLTLGALVAALLVPTTLTPAQADAAPLCTSGLQQADMAGRYVSDFMVVDITPCAVTYVMWANAWGQHAAYYVGTQRYVDGGIIAMGSTPDTATGQFLDATPGIGIKAAERGYIELVTVGGPLGPQVYRLRKTASY